MLLTLSVPVVFLVFLVMFRSGLPLFLRLWRRGMRDLLRVSWTLGLGLGLLLWLRCRLVGRVDGSGLLLGDFVFRGKRRRNIDVTRLLRSLLRLASAEALEEPSEQVF